MTVRAADAAGAAVPIGIPDAGEKPGAPRRSAVSTERQVARSMELSLTARSNVHSLAAFACRL